MLPAPAVLLTILGLLLSPVRPAPSHAAAALGPLTGKGSRLEGLARAVTLLPQPGSADWDAQRRILARDLHPRTGRGFAVLPTAAFFPPPLGLQIHQDMPKPASVNALDGVILPADGKGSVLEMRPGEREAMLALSGWVEKVVAGGLWPAETPQTNILDMRLWTAAKGGLAFKRWHVDGGSLAALLTLVGQGPKILEAAPKMDHYSPREDWEAVWRRRDGFYVARGDILVFSGTQRGKTFKKVRPTVHKSPWRRQDRAAILMRLD